MNIVSYLFIVHNVSQMKQSQKSKGKHIYPRVYQIGLKAEPLNRINLKTKLSEGKKDRKLSSFQREGRGVLQSRRGKTSRHSKKLLIYVM